jgi:hypothetical protein
MRNAYRILVRPEGKKPFRRSMHRSEYNIEIVLKRIWYDSVGWI